MSEEHNFRPSSDRQSSSARIQRYFVGQTIAILLCPSSNGKVFAVTIDKEDLGRVLEAGPWSVSNFDKSHGRVRLYCHSTRRHPGGTVYLHRFVMNAQKGIEIDHIHNRTLDTRKSELRIASKSLNQRNKKQCGPANRFGLRGVMSTRSGRFSARVFVDGKSKILGTYDTPEQASERVREFMREQGAFYAASIANPPTGQ